MLSFRFRMEFAPHVLDEAVGVLRSLVGPVRAEPGCTATGLLRDMDDGSAVTFVEEWRDAESMRHHLHETSFRRILAIMELACGAPIVQIDHVASRRGFELVEQILSQPSSGYNMNGN
jgi:quinol monooxygenase YgiN